MRILATLTYYSPHISGLTIYAQRLYRGLAANGHEITVLTSHYSRGLPRKEVIDGARVVRSPVLLRVSKGCLMPLFPWQAARLIASHDLVHIHLPQFESSLVALLAKAQGKPVVTSYQCDIELPPTVARLVFTPMIRLSHYVAGRLSERIVVTSADYGDSARLSRRFGHKVSAVYPPIELEERPVQGRTLRERCELGSGPLVGFVGRFAAEKGIEYLVNSLPFVFREMPEARCVMAGPTEEVPGERVHERISVKMETIGLKLIHIGVLADHELAEFYRTIDVLVLPSINSTESFGMTQAEAMLAGTPVVCTDLPGVREPVRATGMGELVKPRDERDLARGIVRVLRDPSAYIRPEGEIKRLFNPENTVAFYEDLYAGLLEGRAAPTAGQEDAARSGSGKGEERGRPRTGDPSGEP